MGLQCTVVLNVMERESGAIESLYFVRAMEISLRLVIKENWV